MRKLCCKSLAVAVGLMVTGCAQQSPAVDPVAAVAQLSTGAPLLRCREDCVADWRRRQPEAAELAAAGRWSDLAALVIAVGYQDDLTLYYLGEAAEWLGYPEAAASYYRQSTYISGTSLSCSQQSGVCGGIALPDAALSRIEALDAEARQSRRRVPRRPVTGARRGLIDSKPQPAAGHEPASPAALGPPQPPTLGPPPPAALGPPSPPAFGPPPVPAFDAPPPAALEPVPSAAPEPLPPAAAPVPPAPTRVDPTAKEFIEPPAAR